MSVTLKKKPLRRRSATWKTTSFNQVTVTSRSDRHKHCGGGSRDLSGLKVPTLSSGYASFSMVIPWLLAPFLSLSAALSLSVQEGVLVSSRL